MMVWPPPPGPMAALSLDADPLADAPKPTLQQIEQGKQRKRITAESGSEASGEVGGCTIFLWFHIYGLVRLVRFCKKHVCI